MTLAALIFAPIVDDDAFGAARVTVGSQPLVEFQARTAHRAGAQLILIFVEQIPTDILTCVDRLADDDIKAELVRTAAEVADQIHPDELVLLMAPNIVAEPQLLITCGTTETPFLLGLRGGDASDALERIDGFTHWSGLGVLRGDMVRSTARGVGDWDLCSTLLRSALQSSVPIEFIDLQHEGAPLLNRVATAQEAVAFNRALLSRDTVATNGLIDHFVWTPIAQILLPLMVRFDFEFDWFAAAVGLFALLALASDWLAPIIVAPALYLFSGLGARIAQRLRGISLRSGTGLDLILRGRVLVGGISLIMLARRLVDYGIGWGYYVLALWVLVEFIRLSIGDPWFFGQRNLPRWRASPDAAAAIIIVAHWYNLDILGLEMIIAYALASEAALILRRN